MTCQSIVVFEDKALVWEKVVIVPEKRCREVNAVSFEVDPVGGLEMLNGCPGFRADERTDDFKRPVFAAPGVGAEPVGTVGPVLGNEL